VTPAIASSIRDRAARDPRGVAFREKSLGIWQETTWAEYGDLVERAAHGLLTLGIRPGDRVSIGCDNRPEWLVAYAGAMAAGAVPTGGGAGCARVLIADGQEQVDHALDARARLDWIVYVEPRGVRDYDDESLIWWPDLLARGEEHRLGHHGLLDQLAADVHHTSDALPSGFPADAGPADFVLSQAESRTSTARLHAVAGVQLHFGEPSADLVQTLREVQPSLFLGTAANWTRIHATVAPRMASSRWPARLVRRRLRDRLGLRKCRSAVWAGPIEPEVVEWFHKLGVPLEVA
jgi:long-chain acyl-CoA synthetase